MESKVVAKEVLGRHLALILAYNGKFFDSIERF